MDSLRWLYVDLNSFFASCEQQENAYLRGKPIAVVPLMADTTSCLAASYEAKKFGVKTGVKVGDAKRMCPGIQFVHARHDVYVQYHHRVKEAVESCIPIDGIMSVDEFAAKLTGSQQKEEKARAIAHQIKVAIRTQVGVAITSSIGISTSRFLAKVATDMQKPDGLTVIRKSDLPDKLYSLVLRDIPGVGAKTEQRLNRQGIRSIRDLLKLSQAEMHKVWGGIWGDRMYLWLRGEEVDLPPTHSHSISHQHVLPPEKRSKDGAHEVAKKLLSKLAVRLRRGGDYAKRLTVNVKFMGGMQESWERHMDFDELRDTISLMRKLDELWVEFPSRLKPIRVDISFSNLIKLESHQFTFFENPRLDHLSSVMDKINNKFGKEKIHLGATHEQQDAAPTRIAFRRIPDLDEI